MENDKKSGRSLRTTGSVSVTVGRLSRTPFGKFLYRYFVGGLSNTDQSTLVQQRVRPPVIVFPDDPARDVLHVAGFTATSAETALSADVDWSSVASDLIAGVNEVAASLRTLVSVSSDLTIAAALDRAITLATSFSDSNLAEFADTLALYSTSPVHGDMVRGRVARNIAVAAFQVALFRVTADQSTPQDPMGAADRDAPAPTGDRDVGPGELPTTISDDAGNSEITPVQNGEVDMADVEPFLDVAIGGEAVRLVPSSKRVTTLPGSKFRGFGPDSTLLPDETAIPHDALTVVVGKTGSGKTTFVDHQYPDAAILLYYETASDSLRQSQCHEVTTVWSLAAIVAAVASTAADTVILDSVRRLSFSGRGATAAGGFAVEVLFDLMLLRAVAATLGKRLVVTLNPIDDSMTAAQEDAFVSRIASSVPVIHVRRVGQSFSAVLFDRDTHRTVKSLTSPVGINHRSPVTETGDTQSLSEITDTQDGSQHDPEDDCFPSTLSHAAAPTGCLKFPGTFSVKE